MNVSQIAEVAHETNRAYCKTIGDYSQYDWPGAPDWQRDSAINGVRFHLDNPDAGYSGSHENWLKVKLAAGWKYGEVKDIVKLEHPCCVPYDQLLLEQKVKDSLFAGVVRALKPLLIVEKEVHAPPQADLSFTNTPINEPER